MKIRKPGIAVLFLLPLLALFAFALYSARIGILDQRIDTRNSLKIEGVEKILEEMDKNVSEAISTFQERNRNMSELMPFLLKEYMEDGIYQGPVNFPANGNPDDFIVRIQDNRVILPEDDMLFPDLDPEAVKNQVTFETVSVTDADGNALLYRYNSRRIDGDYYYIDMTLVSDMYERVIRTTRLKETLSEIERTYDCYLIVLDGDRSGGGISEYEMQTFESFISTTPGYLFFSTALDNAKASELKDIAADLSQDRLAQIKLGGENYRVFYKDFVLFGDNVTAIIVYGLDKQINLAASNVILVITLTSICTVMLILYIYWCQFYIMEHELLPYQVRDFQPVQIRKIASTVLVLGTLGIFLVAIGYQTLNNINQEASSDRIGMETILARLDESTNSASELQIDEEEIAVYFAERIAGLISGKPELQTHEALEKINALAGSKFMLLFDSEGKQIAASNMLVRYSLEDSEELFEFNRLLYGLQSLICEPVTEPVLGIPVQYVGARVSLAEENQYGAILLAIDPKESWEYAEQHSIEDFLNDAIPEGNLVLVIDKQSGEVAYSSNPSLVGSVIPDISYDPEEKESSELDVYWIDGSNYYGSVGTDDQYICCYLTKDTYVQISSFAYALISAFGFAVITGIVSWYMLKPYSSKNFKKVVRIREMTPQANESSDFDALTELFDKSEDDNQSLAERWKNLLPGAKAKVYIQILMILALIITFIIQLRVELLEGRSTIKFILNGNWKHGMNMLGWAGVLITVFAFVIISFLKDFLQRILCSILEPRGETIFRLFFSLLQYAGAIAAIYLILGFLGVNTTLQLTSVGIISIAISLGSQNLTADIVAGIFIIFDGDFQVGDIIEVNGFRGVVKEIGVRSTKIIGLGDSLKIMSNKNVKDVLNLSKMNSWYALDVTVAADQPIDEIEKMLRQELPKIGESIPEIISGPYYKGVWEIISGPGGARIKLNILCECDIKMNRRVRRKLNGEVIRLFTEHGYKLS